MQAQIKKHGLLLAAHSAALISFAILAWDTFSGGLGVNPIQEATLRTGKAALIFLVLSLACTPVNIVFKYKPVLRLSKWLGLYAFGYAALHVFIFFWFDYGLDWALILDTILEKRFVLAGLAAFLILLPLAITSTKGWQKRLGKNWKRLHRTVYAANILAVVHYVWLVKSDIREPLVYGGIVLLLLAIRTPVGKVMFRKGILPASLSGQKM